MKQILLIMIGLSVLNAEMIRDSNGIVSDTDTKLQWQDDEVSPSMGWETAINYCESLALGGHSNWRLPNMNELKSIVDKTKAYPAIVDGFINTSSRNYWSSTTPLSSNVVARSVDFADGLYLRSGKDYNYNVRCVRDGE